MAITAAMVKELREMTGAGKQMKHALESSLSVEESILKAQENLLQKQTQENAKNSMKTT
ncbi:MAG: elongation factor Ts, partial [Lachnospiraceae bacterium]|nr:elongation factor Ts [Lachnospiraceae bacterium]